MGFEEIRILKWHDAINSNSWFLAVLKDFSGLPLSFKLIGILFSKLSGFWQKMLFHVSTFNTRVLHPPNHSHQYNTNCGKIQYVMWVTPENFLMHWMVCSVCYYLSRLHGRKYKCVFFSEWRINERDYFQILLLLILTGMEPTIYFQIYC